MDFQVSLSVSIVFKMTYVQLFKKLQNTNARVKLASRRHYIRQHRKANCKHKTKESYGSLTLVTNPFLLNHLPFMPLLSWFLHRARLVCWTLGRWGRSYGRICFWKNSRFWPKGWGLQLHAHSGCHHGLESTHCVTGGASATSNLRL